MADVLTETAYVYDSGQREPAELPAELAEHEHEVHDEVVEGIVVADDELLEHYLAGDVPDFETLEHALAHSVLELNTRSPCCVGRLPDHGAPSASTGWPTSSSNSVRRPPTVRPW